MSLNAKPTPECNPEVQGSGLLDNIKQPARVFSDEAQAWPSSLRRKGLRGASVSHQDKQFTKQVRAAHELPGLSTLAGTQCIDRRWGVMVNSYIPYNLHGKDRKEDGSSEVNTNLYVYCWSLALRYNLSPAGRANLWRSLGQAVRECSK